MPEPPALVLIAGPERVLSDRALDSTLEVFRAHDPQIEVVRLYAADYAPGSLIVHASPSLFGGATAIVLHDADEASDDLQADLLTVIEQAAGDDLRLVVLHKGGNRGKRVLDALKAVGARRIDAPPIKTDREKSDFLTHEFRRARRKATPEAVRALLDAVGRDVGELASAALQLIDDTEGLIDVEQVQEYHGGKVDATGFRVADAAVAGQTSDALRLLRHAIASGLDPVPIVAVLASQLRQVARVATAGGGSSGALAGKLGMAPWQIDRARAAARGWDGDRLGRAIQAVAAADFEVKGGGRDPVYAVEHAILTITRERGAG
ncbi:DNA polymerase III subunit delta [Allobranchiibius sp. GilTou73]|uniref:DNA polymerase III subunit delta n=1 Tax=Allobranchiibius sp. GilTou73 TaxID=2904523 RepID=UPI001F2197E6|nr:DNA polymerase III subunit delta [Allobranchiibius sp. GilTou73]UIJ33462.1 DNA polymerase III subunit delta [Allobranchiibius sp. GilTou73]